jgi:Spy/CpxP family protein refolding chaperone
VLQSFSSETVVHFRIESASPTKLLLRGGNVKGTEFLKLLVTASFMIAISNLAIAQQTNMPAGKSSGDQTIQNQTSSGRISFWQSLSPDQKKQIRQLKIDKEKQMLALRNQIGQKRIEMMEINNADKPEEQAINKKEEEIWGIQDQIRQLKRASKQKFLSILTPEQRQQVRSKMGMYHHGMSDRQGCPCRQQIGMHGMNMHMGMRGMNMQNMGMQPRNMDQMSQAIPNQSQNTEDDLASNQDNEDVIVLLLPEEDQ